MASDRIRELIERSSLGTPEAKALRASVPEEVGRRVVERAKELVDDATQDGDQG